MTICEYSKTEINYMKYLARGYLYAHELAAFIANINPDDLQIHYPKNIKRYKPDRSEEEEKIKNFNEYYDLFWTWNPGPINYNDGHADTEYWLEKILQMKYPTWEEIPDEIIQYIKTQFEDESIKENEHVTRLLSKLNTLNQAKSKTAAETSPKLKIKGGNPSKNTIATKKITDITSSNDLALILMEEFESNITESQLVEKLSDFDRKNPYPITCNGIYIYYKPDESKPNNSASGKIRFRSDGQTEWKDLSIKGVFNALRNLRKSCK